MFLWSDIMRNIVCAINGKTLLLKAKNGKVYVEKHFKITKQAPGEIVSEGLLIFSYFDQ